MEFERGVQGKEGWYPGERAGRPAATTGEPGKISFLLPGTDVYKRRQLLILFCRCDPATVSQSVGGRPVVGSFRRERLFFLSPFFSLPIRKDDQV